MLKALDHWRVTEVKASKISLSEEETIWIKENLTIIVGAQNDWPPFDFVSKGKAKGFSNEYIQALAEKVGLKIKFTPGYAWTEQMELLKRGEIDTLPAIFATDDRKKFMTFTSGYYRNQNGLFVHKDNKAINSLDDMAGKKLAIIPGDRFIELIKMKHPEVELFEVASAAKGLFAVSERQANAYLDFISMGNMLRRDLLIPDLKIGLVAF